METRSQDFKSYLQEELVLRCKRNPSYSLRSFSKAVGVSPSFLSKILNGQRRITDEVFEKIATNLNLEPAIRTAFVREAKPSSDSEMNFHNLQLEYFKIISDWYHYALIELTNLDGFQNSHKSSHGFIPIRLGSIRHYKL